MSKPPTFTSTYLEEVSAEPSGPSTCELIFSAHPQEEQRARWAALEAARRVPPPPSVPQVRYPHGYVPSAAPAAQQAWVPAVSTRSGSPASSTTTISPPQTPTTPSYPNYPVITPSTPSTPSQRRVRWGEFIRVRDDFEDVDWPLAPDADEQPTLKMPEPTISGEAKLTRSYKNGRHTCEVSAPVHTHYGCACGRPGCRGHFEGEDEAYEPPMKMPSAPRANRLPYTPVLSSPAKVVERPLPALPKDLEARQSTTMPAIRRGPSVRPALGHAIPQHSIGFRPIEQVRYDTQPALTSEDEWVCIAGEWFTRAQLAAD